MTKKLKKRLFRILCGMILFAGAVIWEQGWGSRYPNGVLFAFLAAFLVSGGDVVKKAAMNIVRGQVFDENFLMTVATVGAFLVGEYPEGAAVMLFYQVGEWFQSYAVNKSRKSIRELMDIRPDYANVVRDGEVITVEPEAVSLGERIVVKPGERVPLDGVIETGSTALDTMALTGESLPREAGEGDTVISGCVNQSAVIELRVTKEFGESTVSRILELVENAGSRKAESEHFISRFARYYTPVVVGLAVLLAVLPPLFAGGDWYTWIYRALSFLVVSCPCALVISIPLSFFGGLGGASRSGILIKGSNYLEALSKTEIVVMDKTGTLTKGNFAVSRIVPSEEEGTADTKQGDLFAGQEGEEAQKRILELAAYAESGSNHPISRSLQQAYEQRCGREIDRSRISELEDTAGFGVSALIDGKRVVAGNLRHMEQYGIACPVAEAVGTVVYIGLEGTYMGYVVIADEIKEDAKEAVTKLFACGVRDVVMLTGDRKETAESVAEEIGIRHVCAELLPGDKVERMEELLREKSAGGRLVFVGDGMNDAPVLARSDIGIAMGGLGSDAAIEAADVVIMTDEPAKIARAIEISRRTLAIVRQNTIFAIGVKAAILVLAACGVASMWAAVFGDVGVAVIAILNAMRALKA